MKKFAKILIFVCLFVLVFCFWEEIIKAGYPLIKKKIVANKWDDIIPNKQNINLYL